MRPIALLLALLSLTGCALFTKPADTVTFSRGGFYSAYRDISVAYAVTVVKLDLACKAKKLDATFCTVDFPRVRDEMLRVDKAAMKALTVPSAEVDWEAVAEAAKLIASLVGAAL
jgi:hypothetical protein